MAFKTSTDRYSRLVELTCKIIGIQFIPDGYGPWEMLIRTWALYYEYLQCDDILFATLHFIKWGAYPQSKEDPLRWAFNKGTPMEEDTAELLSLFYEELTTPASEGSIELHSWDGFKGVYHYLSNEDISHIDNGPASYSWVHRQFLNNRFDHLVHSFDPTDDRWAHYVRFKEIILRLFQPSSEWSESNWLDERFILQELDREFGTNFQPTPNCLSYLTCLVEVTPSVLPVPGCTLAELPEFTYELATAIWPVNTIARITDAYKAVVKEARQNEKQAKRRKSKQLESHEFGYAKVKTTGIHQLTKHLVSNGTISDRALKQLVFDMEVSQ